MYSTHIINRLCFEQELIPYLCFTGISIIVLVDLWVGKVSAVSTYRQGLEHVVGFYTSCAWPTTHSQGSVIPNIQFVWNTEYSTYCTAFLYYLQYIAITVNLIPCGALLPIEEAVCKPNILGSLWFLCATPTPTQPQWVSMILHTIWWTWVC